MSKESTAHSPHGLWFEGLPFLLVWRLERAETPPGAPNLGE
jgi:hypothetical protein